MAPEHSRFGVCDAVYAHYVQEVHRYVESKSDDTPNHFFGNLLILVKYADSLLIDMVPMSLGIKLAYLASTKEFVDLEEWLGTNLSASEDVFFEEFLRFLKEVEENSVEIWNMYKETVPTFTKVLQSHADLLASKQMESFNVTYTQNSPEMENTDDPDPTTSESYADHINAKYAALKTHFLSLLPMAMNKAIEELLSATVNRSVSITTQTAIELVLKDYINDLDEDSIHNASSFMVTYVARSLSYITYKELLRNLTSTHLRNSVKGLNFASEDAMKCVVDETHHLRCALIERDATEKVFKGLYKMHLTFLSWNL